MPIVNPPDRSDDEWRDSFEALKRASEEAQGSSGNGSRRSPEARVFAVLFMLLLLAGMLAGVVWAWQAALG